MAGQVPYAFKCKEYHNTPNTLNNYASVIIILIMIIIVIIIIIFCQIAHYYLRLNESMSFSFTVQC